jgi:hypothetical protein
LKVAILFSILGHRKNESEFKADLIEKFSFAIPFRENPLGNPADTLRLKSAPRARQSTPTKAILKEQP